jgi:hypothetical protein
MGIVRASHGIAPTFKPAAIAQGSNDLASCGLFRLVALPAEPKVAALDRSWVFALVRQVSALGPRIARAFGRSGHLMDLACSSAIRFSSAIFPSSSAAPLVT